MTNPNEIQEVTVEATLIAGIRMKAAYSECGKGFSKLGRAAGRFICGKAFCLFYDEGYREVDADFEVCFPVRKAITSEGIDCRELPGGKFLSLTHVGPYSEVGPTYQALIAQAKEQGLTTHTPCREVYVKGPGMIFRGNPKKYVTDVLLPISNE